jgi:aspartate aminotransferase
VCSSDLYGNYVKNFNAQLSVVPPNPPHFLPNPEALRLAITERTRAVIINSPNNPAGCVYSVEAIKDIASELRDAQARFGKPIYLIADEPYREIVYDCEVPYLPDLYDNTIVVYSYSKSLSLPGERIGYVAVSKKTDGAEEIANAVAVATRVLGFVNAPSLQQLAVSHLLDISPNINIYRTNRDLLCEALHDAGFEFDVPQGAFYLFVKSPIFDDAAFCEHAKQYNILVVPGRAFGAPGYFRLAYCVSTDMIKRSLPAWEKLAKDFR